MASLYPIIAFPGFADLSGVDVAGAVLGDVLYFDGTNWADTDPSTATVLTMGAGGIIFEESGAGTDTVTIAPAAAITASYTLTLPPDDGTAGQALTTDGAGVTTWTSFATDLNSLTDVTISSATTGDVFYFNGAVWRDTDLTTTDVLTMGSGGILFEESGAGTDTVTIAPPAAITATYTLTLPPDDGTAGQALTTDGAGVTTWTTFATDLNSLTDVTISSATTGDVFYFNGAVWRDTDLTTTDVLTMGSGGILFEESGAGTATITIAPPAVATSTYTLTLPVNPGTVGQQLTTDGTGVLSWTAASGGGTVTSVISVGGGSFDVQSGISGGGTTIDIKTIEDGDNIVIDEDTTDRLNITGCVTEGVGPTGASALAVGEVVYYDRVTGLWEQASADAAGATTLATAIVVKVISAVTGDYIIGHWGIFSALPTLISGEGGGAPTTGDYVYASTATGPTEPGLVQATIPASGTYNNPVGQRVSATEFYFAPWRAFLA